MTTPSERRGWAARASIAIALCAVVGLLASACTGSHSSTGSGVPAQPSSSIAAREHRPNIVFVLTDDLASNLVQYMPHVLALEHQGTTFTNYIVSDSLCCPSRSSIFTGLYPHDTHVLGNEPAHGGFITFFRRGEQNHTFATALQAVGYRTAMMGKYLNGYTPSDPPRGKPTPYVPTGWSQWDVTGDQGYSQYNYNLTDNHSIKHYGHGRSDYLTTVLRNRALQFLGSTAQQRNPFMLEVATYAPHEPFVPAPEDKGTFPGLKAPRTAAFDTLPTDPPAWLRNRAPLTPKQTSYIDRVFERRVESVQSVDRMIGAIEQELRHTGRLSNTIFVFSSDNGLHMGEHRLTPGKLTAYDTDIRVPLVMAGPGIAAGVTNSAIVQNVDLAPTFEALGGTAVSAGVEGRNLVPLLHGRTPADWRTVALVEHHGPVTNRGDPDFPAKYSGDPPTYVAIRTARFTYVHYADGEREYYDHATDPAEVHNLAGDLTPQVRSQLDAVAQALHSCHGGVACQHAGIMPALTGLPSPQLPHSIP